ncbi:DNA repair protein [Sphingomonas changnyeongensis]|uniref:DNA repair protein n=1 Tax=Sphingomonas changnyeongensis TaxID=2698679 RepID=A0A7Z2S446_9SPHN|nr:JAB domain-containing protein [Sphingomonas changnyeongensis]QHL89670.1 DNA repair protein [Sphingomonas changnyeongensis]
MHAMRPAPDAAIVDMRVGGGPVIDRPGAAYRLLAPGLVWLRHERLAVLHLTRDRRLIAQQLFEGRAADIDLPARTILARALDVGAAGIVLAHNHPGGDPMPSPGDIAATRRLVALLGPVGVLMHDHLVIARADWTSFYLLGLL